MRYEDWPQRLDQCIADRRRFTWQWGTFDCCMFVADALLAMTGTDFAQPWRGTYSDKAGTDEILAPFDGLEGLLMSQFGAPVHPSQAMRGDVVIYRGLLVDGTEADCAGICLGVQCAFPVARGFRYVPTTQMRLAWRIV